MSRLSITNLERLNTWTPEIARSLRPDAPVKQQPNGSLRLGNKGALVIGPASGLWFDYEASKGGVNALSLIGHLQDNGFNPVAWAQKFLEGKTQDGPLTHNPESCEETQAAFDARAEYARHVLEASRPIKGTPAEAYLKSRGIDAPHPETLRYLQEARIGEGALITVVTTADGTPIAVQLTYLDPRGRKSTVAPQRRLFPLDQEWAAQGLFRLSAKDAPDRTIIVEGVEDALSLWKAGAARQIAACLGISNLGKAAVAAGSEVVVFRDGDPADAPASEALVRGTDRLLLADAIVKVTPTPEGEDANSIHQAEGGKRLVALVDEAGPAELSRDGWLEKCAAMDPPDYEQARHKIAKDLRLRVSFLDNEVRRRRAAEDKDAEQEAPLGIQDIEPWPEDVDLAAVLNEIAAGVKKYVFMPAPYYDTVALWAAHTHVMDLLGVSPRLALQSPAPGCGKTVLLEAVSLLVPRPLTAASITTASVFRVIEMVQPTLLIDEADQLFRGDNRDLIAVLNSSHRKSSAYIMRVVEINPGDFQPTQFSTWTPTLLASIKQLPQTLQDRSIIILLQRALPGEVSHHLRDGYCQALANCGRKLARWAKNMGDLVDADMPPELTNRVGDNWRPLFAIAELAGGDWPQRVRAAAKTAVAASEDDISLLVRLLCDTKDAFGDRAVMSSAEIVEYLLGLDDGPYQEANRGRSINQYWLSRQLNGVIQGRSNTIRVGTKTPKGYRREQFEGAWRRYAILDFPKETHSHPPKQTATSATTPQPAETEGVGAELPQQANLPHRNTNTSNTQMLRCGDAGRGTSSTKNPKETGACGGVADVAASKAGAEIATSTDGTTDKEDDPLKPPRFLDRRSKGDRREAASTQVADTVGLAKNEERW